MVMSQRARGLIIVGNDTVGSTDWLSEDESGAILLAAVGVGASSNGVGEALH